MKFLDIIQDKNIIILYVNIIKYTQRVEFD